MELEETVYWLEMLGRDKTVGPDRVAPLIDEAKQLTAIFVSLIKKWKPVRRQRAEGRRARLKAEG